MLQQCFKILHIDRHIATDRLLSGKRLDDLEFKQWFKRHYESIGAARGGYDCFAERMKGKGGAKMMRGSGNCSIRPSPSSLMKTNYLRVSNDMSHLRTSLIRSNTAPSPIEDATFFIVKDVAGISNVPRYEEKLNNAQSVKTNLSSIKILLRSDAASGPDHATAYTNSKMKMMIKKNERLRNFKMTR